MHYTLGKWAKGIASQHGVALQWRTTTGFAQFLSQDVPKIALDEDVGHVHHGSKSFVRRAETIINPPVPPRESGRARPSSRRPKVDASALPRSPLTVTHPKSHARSHPKPRVDDLIKRLWNDVDERRLTRRSCSGCIRAATGSQEKPLRNGFREGPCDKPVYRSSTSASS